MLGLKFQAVSMDAVGRKPGMSCRVGLISLWKYCIGKALWARYVQTPWLAWIEQQEQPAISGACSKPAEL